MKWVRIIFFKSKNLVISNINIFNIYFPVTNEKFKILKEKNKLRKISKFNYWFVTYFSVLVFALLC